MVDLCGSYKGACGETQQRRYPFILPLQKGPKGAGRKLCLLGGTHTDTVYISGTIEGPCSAASCHLPYSLSFLPLFPSIASPPFSPHAQNSVHQHSLFLLIFPKLIMNGQQIQIWYITLLSPPVDGFVWMLVQPPQPGEHVFTPCPGPSRHQPCKDWKTYTLPIRDMGRLERRHWRPGTSQSATSGQNMCHF